MNTLDTLFNHAIVCGRERRWKDALASYEEILRVAPGHALAWNNRGNVLQLFGRWDDALASYDRALTLDAGYADAVYNRATLLHRLRRWAEALAGYETTIRMRPDHADAHNNRAVVLDELGRSDEALGGFDVAVALRPAYAQAHSNKARVLQELGRWQEALDNLEKAVALEPGLVEAQWNRALLLLTLGDYERGWKAYEWRWKVGTMRPFVRQFTQPSWSGIESLQGKRILLHAEQGVGDAVQFSRYVPAVAARAKRVILEVAPAIRPVLAENFSGIDVIARGDALPPFDVQCALGSLPLAFGTTLATIPPAVPMRAEAAKSKAWAARVGARSGTRIGIAWAGNPEHINDARRSIPYERIVPLLREPFEFHVLQRELRGAAAGLRGAFPNVRVWAEELRDFSDTAGLIDELDLVITIDTGVAHLAASMGKPTWLLVASVPDFRWLLERRSSPWYPAVRLFRQPRRHDWESVVAEVRAALKAGYR